MSDPSVENPPDRPYHLRMGVRVNNWRIDSHGRQCYRIRWYFKRTQHQITRDQTGGLLTDPVKTKVIADKIALEIDEKKHDPIRWMPERRNKYAIANAIDAYCDARQIDADHDRLSKKQFSDIYKYLHRFKDFCHEIKIMDIRDVDGLEYQKFVNKKLSSFAYKTQKNCITCLDTFFGWLVKKAGLLDKQPIKPAISKPKKQREIKWLDAKQQKAALKKIPEAYQPIFRFMMAYGCRPSEALAVQLKDVDWKNGVIIIRHSISDGELKERTKTNKVRFLPIVDSFRPWLKKATANRIGKDYLFVKDGKRFTIWTLDSVWRKVRPGNITLVEATRKSFATMMFNSGAKPEDVAEMIGNSPAILMEHYAKVTAGRFKHLFKQGNIEET